MVENSATPVHGIDLRLMRTARRVTGAAVARAAGWPAQRVSLIEAYDRPSARSIRRYLAALDAIAAGEAADR